MGARRTLSAHAAAHCNQRRHTLGRVHARARAHSRANTHKQTRARTRKHTGTARDTAAGAPHRGAASDTHTATGRRNSETARTGTQARQPGTEARLNQSDSTGSLFGIMAGAAAGLVMGSIPTPVTNAAPGVPCDVCKKKNQVELQPAPPPRAGHGLRPFTGPAVRRRWPAGLTPRTHRNRRAWRVGGGGSAWLGVAGGMQWWAPRRPISRSRRRARPRARIPSPSRKPPPHRIAPARPPLRRNMAL